MMKWVMFCSILFLIPFGSAALSCVDNEPSASPYTRGALEVKQIGVVGREYYADSCVNSSVVKEYYCEGTEPIVKEILCEGTCIEGACIIGERTVAQLQNTLALSYCGEYGFETPLTAYAPSLQAYPATKAVDQQRETHWFSKIESQQPELLIDLGDAKCLDFITLFFFIKDIPLTAKLDASVDGAIWKEILPEQQITEQKADFSLTPVYARYLKLIQTKTTRSYGQVSEIVVSTAEVPDIQMTQLAVVTGDAKLPVPRASFLFNKNEKTYQTDQYGKTTLVTPKEAMSEVQVICPTTAGSVFQGAEEPSVTPTATESSSAFSRLSFFTEWIATTASAIFDDPSLDFQKLSQTECSVTGAQNEEFEVPGGYEYTPSCNCASEILEVTGEYKAVSLGANYMDLFIFLVKGSKGYRFRTSNQYGDTPGNYITGLPVTLSSQWNCWSGAPCPGGETGGLSNYDLNTWVPFKLIRNYDQVIWEVNGQEVDMELSDYATDKLAIQFGGWNDRGKNMIRNTKIICGEPDPEAPPVQQPQAPENPGRVNNATNSTVNSTNNGTITLPSFEQEVVPQLQFEVIQIRETLKKIASKEVSQKLTCGVFELISPPEVYASDTRQPYKAQLAIDNNFSSGWFGDPDVPFPKTFTADLNQIVCMNRVDLYVHQPETPLLIDIQVSTDGKVWDTLVKNYELKGDRYVGVPFPTTVTGRYLRIIQQSSIRPFGSVQELYISAAPQIPAQPFFVSVVNEQNEKLEGVSVAVKVNGAPVKELTTVGGGVLLPDAFSLHGKTIEVSCPAG
jgi:hypothetical protein